MYNFIFRIHSRNDDHARDCSSCGSARSLNPGLPGASALPHHSEARQSLEALKDQFPDVNVDPILVIAQTSDGSNMLTEQNMNRFQSLSQRFATLPHVARVTDLLTPPAVRV